MTIEWVLITILISINPADGGRGMSHQVMNVKSEKACNDIGKAFVGMAKYRYTSAYYSCSKIESQ